MSGLLLVAAILKRTRTSPAAWSRLYTPLHSRLATLRVADRYAITTECMETRIAQPTTLQAAIDDLVTHAPSGRAFVRPSGTEDVVRVYAEAAGLEACETLCLHVLRATHQHAGGLGPMPCSL